MRANGIAAGLLLVWLTCVPTAKQAAGQQRTDTTARREVELLDVRLLEGTTIDGVRVNRLSDARLRQGTTYIEADETVEYVNAGEYVFEGNVLIIDEGDSLSAQRVVYDSNLKVGRATTDVRISDGEILVFAPSGRYFVDEKRAEFDQGVRLIDSTAVVESRTGIYLSEEKRGEFGGDVELREGPTFLSADSLTVLRETRQSYAVGDVFIERFGGEETTADEGGVAIDSTVVTLLMGEEAFTDDVARLSRVGGQPVVVQLRRDTTDATVDTTIVRAGEIVVSRADSLDRLIGIDSVRVWQRTFSAVGDSITYDRQTLPDASVVETLYLLQGPVAWFESTQVTGDTIRVKSGTSPVDTLHVRGNAFVSERDTTLDRINQLAGRRLRGLFENDTLRTLFVGPNARAIRYMAGDDGALSQAVRLSGDDAVIRFVSDETIDVRFEGDVEGQAYAPELIPTPFDLEGFSWTPERRPTREALVDLDRLEARRRAANEDDSALSARAL